jgi:hypothetical protein
MKKRPPVEPAIIPVAPVHGEHSRSRANNDLPRLLNYIQRRINLHELELSEAFYYSSLPQCVIDAVYSISARYSATTKSLIRN